MKAKINIQDYSNRLFAVNNSAAIWLEEDFDPDCNYTWTAAGEDWADKFQAELEKYIPNCEQAAKNNPRPDDESIYYWVDYAKRAEEYKQALAMKQPTGECTVMMDCSGSGKESHTLQLVDDLRCDDMRDAGSHELLKGFDILLYCGKFGIYKQSFLRCFTAA